MRGRSSAVLRVLGTIAVVAVLVVAVLWITVIVLLPHDRVLTLVRGQLARSLLRQARLDDVSLSLWPPVRLQAKGFAIAEPGGFARGVAARIGALDFDLDLLPLLSRRVVVRRLVLERPMLHVVLRADGTTSLDSLIAPAPAAPARGPSPPMNLAVRSFEIRGGEALVDAVRAQRRVFFGLDTRLALSAEGGTVFATKGRTRLSRIAFGPLAARGPSELNQSLAALAVGLEHDGRFDAARKTLALDRLALELGRARLALSGTIADLGPRPEIDLRAQGADVDLGELLAYASLADARAVRGIRGGGRLGFDLRLAGRAAPPSLPAITGTLAIADGSFRYPGAPAGVDGLSFHARFAPDQVEIGDLRARVAGQPLRAQLAASRFADAQVRFAVQGTLDLAALSQLLAPPDTKLAGRALLDVRGNGRAKDPGSFVLDGRVAISDASLETRALPRKVEAISANVQLAPDHAALRGFTARAGQSSFALDAALTRPLALLAKPGKVAPADLTFTLRSPYLDVAELLPPGPGGPMAFNVRGGGKVEITRFRNQRLDLQDVVANVAFEPAVVTVPSFALRAYGGTAQGSARFGFEDPANPSFRVAGHADSIGVDPFLSAWSAAARGLVSGAASTNFDLSGDGVKPAQLSTSLTAMGLALLADGRLGGPVMEAIAAATRTPSLREVRFHDLRLPFRVEHGRVVTDSLRFRVGAGAWLASGAAGFDGSLDYAVSATLPAEIVGRSGLAQSLASGLLSDAQGNLLVDLRVTGNGRAPRVTLNQQAMRERLAGRASSLIQQQRTRLTQELLQTAAPAPMDSTGRAQPVDTKALGKELKKQGQDLFRSLFGGKKAPPDTTK
jgi:uncharacterized protein involved in outer membrane biogenesis